MDYSDSHISLLYVDDEPSLLDVTKRYLEHTGNFSVETAASAIEGLNKIQEQEYDAVISDYQMPEMDGLVFLRTLREKGNRIPFVIFTGRGREEVAIEALNAGADFYLQKGGKPKVQYGELQNFIRQAVDKNRAEGLYKTVFENTGTATLILEEDTTIVRINEMMEHLWGYSRKECENLEKWPDHVAEKDRATLLKYHCLRRKKQGLAPKRYECRIVHKSGDIRTVSLTAAMIPGSKKSIISLIDITSRKEAERRLKFTQFMADNAPDGMLWADTDGRFFSVNQSAIDMFGYSKEELLNMCISDFAPDFPEERFREFWDKAKKQGSFSFEARVVRNSGDSATIELSIVFLHFEGRDYECGFARDITERKKVEEALRESEEKFREVFNSTGDIIFLNDSSQKGPPGRFIEVNNAACRILGYSREEMLCMSIADIEAPQTRDEVAEIEEQFRTKGRATFDAVGYKKDGSKFSLEMNACNFMLNNRRMNLSVGRDTTERKKAENALKLLNKKLTLLSSVTRHDINNQTTVLLGYEEMLNGRIDEDNREYLKPIIEATEKIQEQIIFTREYQEIGLQSPTWQSVESVAQSAVSKLPEKDAIIRIDTGTLEIYADLLLEKVVYNLFENAFRHGGNVTDISISFHEKDGDGIVVIEDNGTGVADDMKEEIFGRGVGSNTGFGLFLTREILEITGLAISETGTEGKGARFEIAVKKNNFRFMP